MFLDKVRSMGGDWGIPKEKLPQVARESLLYGMKLNSSPNALKRCLRPYNVDTKFSTKTFKGNAYLLHQLPQALVAKKNKIQNLSDYMFAKSILNKEQIQALKERVAKLQEVNIHSLYTDNLNNLIRIYSNKGSFFTEFDKMYEGNTDFKQDVAVESLVLLNTQVDKLKAYDEDTVGRYMNTCLGKKSNTLVSSGVTQSFKTVREVVEEVVPEVRVYSKEGTTVIPAQVRKTTVKKTVSIFQSFDNENVAENLSFNSEESEDMYEENFESVELKHDLKKILPDNVFNGVALYCGFAPLEVAQGFDEYLSSKGLMEENLSDYKRRKHIETYLKTPVFTRAKEIPQLREYFLAG